MTRLHHIALGFALALCAVFAVTPNAAFALGSTPVTVVNPADIAKAEGIQQPFASESVCNSATGGNCIATFNVPASARWVIETAGFNCIGQPFANVLAVIYSIATGDGGGRQFVATPLNLNGAGFIQSAQNVRFYANAGSMIDVEFASDATTVNCSFSLSGQQITVP